jgi:hypothetical protein
MFRRKIQTSNWEYCGMTPHDEKVNEFEEMSEEEYVTVVIALEHNT